MPPEARAARPVEVLVRALLRRPLPAAFREVSPGVRVDIVERPAFAGVEEGDSEAPDKNGVLFSINKKSHLLIPN